MNVTELFTDKYYIIPTYQRGYSWTQEQWREFLEDLEGHPAGKPQYLGVLTLEEVKNTTNQFRVVDGQQRLTTLLILAAVLCHKLLAGGQNNPNDQRIIDLDNLSCDQTKRLRLRYELDGNDRVGDTNVLHQLLLADHQQMTDPAANIQHTSIYTKRLIEAYKYYFRTINDQKAGDLANRIFTFEFVTHPIEHWQALVVFEQLNNRGKPISIMEKLKNRLLYLSARMNEGDLANQINTSWSHVYKVLGKFEIAESDSQDELDTEFLRDHWIMRWGRQRERAGAFTYSLLKTTFTLKRLGGKLDQDGDFQSVCFDVEQIKEPRRVLQRLDFSETPDERSSSNNYLLENFFTSLVGYVKTQEGATTKSKLDNCDQDELRAYLVEGLNNAIRYQYLLNLEELQIEQDLKTGFNNRANNVPACANRLFLEYHLNNDGKANYVEICNMELLTPIEISDYCKELKESIDCWYAIHERSGIESLFNNAVRDDHPNSVKELGKWLARIRILKRKDAVPLMVAALLKLIKNPTDAAFEETNALLASIERLAFLDSMAGLGISKDKVQALARGLYLNAATLQQAHDEIDLLVGPPPHVFQAFNEAVAKRSEKRGFYKAPAIDYLLYEFEWHLIEKKNREQEGNVVINLSQYSGERDLDRKGQNDQPGLQKEHIFPQNPLTQDPPQIEIEAEDYWPSFYAASLSDMERKICLDSLGNLVFVNGKFNRDLSNWPYIVPPGAPELPERGGNPTWPKQSMYAQADGCLGAQEIAMNYQIWTPHSILCRGIKMLEFVEARWRTYLGTPADKKTLLGLEFVEGDLPTDNRLINAIDELHCGECALNNFSVFRAINDRLSNFLREAGITSIRQLVDRHNLNPQFVLNADDDENEKNRKLLYEDIIVALIRKDHAAISKMFPATFDARLRAILNGLSPRDREILGFLYSGRGIPSDIVYEQQRNRYPDLTEEQVCVVKNRFSNALKNALEQYQLEWTPRLVRNLRLDEFTRNDQEIIKNCLLRG
jgi:hypothetical protein